METVKVKCPVTEGNDQGFYLCDPEQVPEDAEIVGAEPKKKDKKAK